MSVLQTHSYFHKDAPTIALQSLFDKYDLDKDGQLDKTELYNLLKEDLGLTKDESEIYRYLLDKNADSMISFQEFVAWLNSGERFKTIDDKTRFHYLHKAVLMFKKYDLDESLGIDKQEFHMLFTELGGEGSKTESEALKEMDLDKNGRISFQEFMRWLNWVPLEHLIMI